MLEQMPKQAFALQKVFSDTPVVWGYPRGTCKIVTVSLLWLFGWSLWYWTKMVFFVIVGRGNGLESASYRNSKSQHLIAMASEPRLWPGVKAETHSNALTFILCAFYSRWILGKNVDKPRRVYTAWSYRVLSGGKQVVGKQCHHIPDVYGQPVNAFDSCHNWNVAGRHRKV